MKQRGALEAQGLGLSPAPATCSLSDPSLVIQPLLAFPRKGGHGASFHVPCTAPTLALSGGGPQNSQGLQPLALLVKTTFPQQSFPQQTSLSVCLGQQSVGGSDLMSAPGCQSYVRTGGAC